MQQISDLEQRLSDALGARIGEVLTHPYLQRLGAGELRADALGQFVSQYSRYCGVFPRCVAAVAANVPDDRTRLPLVRNLWEEHGEGDLGASHRTLFAKFHTAVRAITPAADAAALEATEDYVSKVLSLCRDSDYLTGLGALGPGTESFTSQEYSLMLHGLRATGMFEERDLEFFTVHVGADDEHYSQSLEAIAPWIDSDAKFDRVISGARSAIKYEVEFWDAMQVAR